MQRVLDINEVSNKFACISEAISKLSTSLLIELTQSEVHNNNKGMNLHKEGGKVPLFTQLFSNLTTYDFKIWEKNPVMMNIFSQNQILVQN